MTNQKVQILLSTYNGEKYIREQLNSYLELGNYEVVKVLIRDDGSADHTTQILKEYSEKYGFEIIFGDNLGVTRSINWLFKHCDLSCDYFAISDQDDVWLKDKIERALTKLTTINSLTPVMFASCSKIVDENLNPIGSTIIPRKGISFFNAMVQNVTPGHTMILNRALIQKINQHDFSGVYLVDWWFYLVASGIGEVIFDASFTVLHRQHRNNVVGYELNYWKMTRNKIRNAFRNTAKQISNQLKGFYSSYGQALDGEKKRELERFLFCQENLLDRIRYVFSCQVFRQSFLETIALKILYLAGKFKI